MPDMTIPLDSFRDAFSKERDTLVDSFSDEAAIGQLLSMPEFPTVESLRRHLQTFAPGHRLARLLPLLPVPNPGSDEAVDAGCLCPQLDNGRGRGSGHGPGQFWITGGCPLHDASTTTPA